MTSLLTTEEELRYVETRKGLNEGRVKVESLDSGSVPRLEREATDREKKMAPAGALGLPPLLDHRRLQYGIIDSAFHYGGQAAWDKVLVHQIPQWEGDTYGDTRIIMPESAKRAEAQTAPRAIIVSAGLIALDQLRSNGMDLGHIVTFANQGHWRLRVGNVGGSLEYLIILQTGDIVSSEDTRRLIDMGLMKIDVLHPEGAAPCHVYMGSGPLMVPVRPNATFDE